MTSIPKKVRIYHIVEEVQVPLVSPIEMKQEQVRSGLEREVIRHVAANDILYWCRGKTTSCHIVIKLWVNCYICDLLREFFHKTSVQGLGQDLGLITALEGAMTSSTNVSRIVFDLLPSPFKVRNMFSA
ncbi:hypothetical protein F2Q68_00015606 [Brassica cretica]|uniref:Uncharacterized protein n=2 Tax=Brassica cretica TaxID=69181 RepID=A0A8S9HER7_BRACR|nr:hypothetical protein F2Q68_00015606 [Brassica cretica]KAF3608737.1 hypothetical protein DY000_02048213 [Brassica cretica]